MATSGKRFPAGREHFQKNIAEVYNNFDVSFKSFPSDSTERDPKKKKKKKKKNDGLMTNAKSCHVGHTILYCESMVPNSPPLHVIASGSKSLAEGLGCVKGTKDTIALLINWQNRKGPFRIATGVYTARYHSYSRSWEKEP